MCLFACLCLCALLCARASTPSHHFFRSIFFFYFDGIPVYFTYQSRGENGQGNVTNDLTTTTKCAAAVVVVKRKNVVIHFIIT